ncbi:hypothetical protein HOD08_03710 [bacterium]|nr:hypothetical protein [bacterium]
MINKFLATIVLTISAASCFATPNTPTKVCPASPVTPQLPAIPQSPVMALSPRTPQSARTPKTPLDQFIDEPVEAPWAPKRRCLSFDHEGPGDVTRELIPPSPYKSIPKTYETYESALSQYLSEQYPSEQRHMFIERKLNEHWELRRQQIKLKNMLDAIKNRQPKYVDEIVRICEIFEAPIVNEESLRFRTLKWLIDNAPNKPSITLFFPELHDPECIRKAKQNAAFIMSMKNNKDANAHINDLNIHYAEQSFNAGKTPAGHDINFIVYKSSTFIDSLRHYKKCKTALSYDELLELTRLLIGEHIIPWLNLWFIPKPPRKYSRNGKYSGATELKDLLADVHAKIETAA